jgi:hypothetical protein
MISNIVGRQFLVDWNQIEAEERELLAQRLASILNRRKRRLRRDGAAAPFSPLRWHQPA